MDNSNINPQQQLIEKLKSSTNILVTVSSNPSVDQLAACLGLTLWLNKIGKHGTAVFSGEVPSTLEFLQPEDTLEKTTDSLRDFIISLDKSKADKLRYKVEDTVVKIFITPYRTNLTADDLEFSQGDFNVDMVVALGVNAQEDLDTAITAHGRILHDATVATISSNPDSQLGSINWSDTQTSSLSELIVDLGNLLDRTVLDGQIATALLTGIVSETARFSNEKTTPQTMSISAELMSAGANQQLVASKLEEPVAPSAAEEPPEDSAEDVSDEPEGEPEPPKPDDGTLEIEHSHDEEVPESHDQSWEEPVESPEQPSAEPEPADVPQESSEAQPEMDTPAESVVDEVVPVQADEPTNFATERGSKLIVEPPSLGGTLTANSRPDDEAPDPITDPLSLPSVEANQPLLNHDVLNPTVDNNDSALLQPAPADWMPPDPADEPVVPPMPNDTETLTQIEHEVNSPHTEVSEPAQLDTARDEVARALNSVPDTNLPPVEALNAQPMDLTPLAAPETATVPVPPVTAFDPATFGTNEAPAPLPMPAPVDQANPLMSLPLPPAMPLPVSDPMPTASPIVLDPTAPPPVPPPMIPPMFPPAS